MIEVIKRDGRIKNFNKDKIADCIAHSREEIGVEDDNLDITVSELVEQYIVDNNINEIGIEEIQDLVIEFLKQENKEVANAYEEYRNQRSMVRVHPIEKSINELINGNNDFLSRENANKDSTLLPTTRDLMAGTISRHMARKMIPKEILDAHDRGEIKIHDLDYFVNPMTNCCLIPLRDMFENGTVINGKKIETPKSLNTAMTLATQIITQVTSNQYGGCTISLSHLAPYVRVSKEKWKKIIKQEGMKNNINYTEEQIKQISKDRVKTNIKDGVQTFNYQINTMSSTNGQTPFNTIFVYLSEDEEYKEETAMLAEEFFRQRIEGMPDKNGNKVTQTFPKIIFVLDEDNVPKDSEYHWLLELAMKSTAKRMCPDYISAKKMKKLYGDVFPCMGCLQGDEIVTYRFNNNLYVESFKRMWNRLSKSFDIKEQYSKGNYYIDLNGIEIYDTKEGFVNCRRIIRNDSSNWVKVKMSNGRIWTCTDDHPFEIIGKGEVKTKDLKIGDKVLINTKQYSSNKIEYDLEKAWLMGLVLCDGGFSSGLNILLGLDEKEIVDKAVEILKNKYNVNTKVIERHRGIKGNYYEINSVDSKIHKDFIRIFEGKNKIDRHIPNEVFEWNYESRINFLAGMIDADGYVNNHRYVSTVQLGSTNKELALQQMALIQSLGVKASVYENHYCSNDKSKIRYRVECIATNDIVNSLVCIKKREHLINNKRKNKNKCDQSISEIKSIEYITIDEFSYDVTTDSEHFEASGVYSHNCRSFLFPWIDPTTGKYKWYGRMNLGVCTLNIPDIALSSKGNRQLFWEIFEYRMENIVKPACIMRYDKLKGYKAKVSPIMWQHGVFARANAEEYITDILDKSGYSISIGYNGIYEAVKYMTGKSHTSKEGFEFAEQIMKFMNDKVNKWKKDLNIGFSVYQTPQEESTDWFTKKLIKKFGIVEDITSKGYITNSYHVDVREEIDAFSKFELEGRLQKYSLGGNVSYCETNDLTDNIDAMYEIIKHIYNNNIHAEINNDGSCKCFKCGYEGKMDYDSKTLEFICPNCKNRDLSFMSIVLRVCGYLSSKGTYIAGRFKDIINRIKHI